MVCARILLSFFPTYQTFLYSLISICSYGDKYRLLSLRIPGHRLRYYVSHICHKKIKKFIKAGAVMFLLSYVILGKLKVKILFLMVVLYAWIETETENISNKIWQTSKYCSDKSATPHSNIPEWVWKCLLGAPGFVGSWSFDILNQIQSSEEDSMVVISVFCQHILLTSGGPWCFLKLGRSIHLKGKGNKYVGCCEQNHMHSYWHAELHHHACKHHWKC